MGRWFRQEKTWFEWLTWTMHACLIMIIIFRMGWSSIWLGLTDGQTDGAGFGAFCVFVSVSQERIQLDGNYQKTVSMFTDSARHGDFLTGKHDDDNNKWWYPGNRKDMSHQDNIIGTTWHDDSDGSISILGSQSELVITRGISVILLETIHSWMP